MAEQLQSGEHFNNELLCRIAQIYEGASDAKFSQWATINLYDKVVQQVKELRVIDKSALDEKLWTCELMICQSNAKDDAMVVAGRYTSATTEKTDEQTMAHGYIAAMNAAVETAKHSNKWLSMKRANAALPTAAVVLANARNVTKKVIVRRTVQLLILERHPLLLSQSMGRKNHSKVLNGKLSNPPM